MCSRQIFLRIRISQKKEEEDLGVTIERSTYESSLVIFNARIFLLERLDFFPFLL